VAAAAAPGRRTAADAPNCGGIFLGSPVALAYGSGFLEVQMPDGSARTIRRGRKFDQVLEGAREVFLTDGYVGASVDDIARRAGVSKATLYSYFPNKALLFMEVAKTECLRVATEATEAIDRHAAVDQILTEVGCRIMDFVTSDFGQRIFRICVAESERFPDFGRDFYESGPAMARERLTEFLGEATERGELAIDDLELAADQFQMLCKADIHDRLIFAADEAISPEARKRIIDGAVEMFMARYRA